MSCPHIDNILPTLTPPRLSQQVHKEECTQCFDDFDSPSSHLICLHCFNGGCLSSNQGQGSGQGHAQLHYERTGHALGMVVRRERTESSGGRGRRNSQEPPQKLQKLTIEAPPTDEELYTYQYSFRCFLCASGSGEIGGDDERLAPLKASIISSHSSAQQSEIKAWEEELQACEHTLMLGPGQGEVSAGFKVPPTCTHCPLSTNLWLCLTCGSVNCGRKQIGGADGNGHALEHFKETGHGVGVKLGTITVEGGGDIYCYDCDDSRLDLDLPTHLQHFGLNVSSMEKTDKSVMELQIEHNLKFDFSMTGDDGKELEPVFGPGLTGLKNLGNSCYMASVLQGIFALPAFQKRYPTSSTSREHSVTCSAPLPAECLECQMLKISDGLQSGRYSHPAKYGPAPSSLAEHKYQDETEVAAPKFQEGIKPSMFKALVGKGHEEFSTMRQQDSEEFLQHLIKVLRQESKRKGTPQANEATEIFRFGMEQRLECTECHGVRYKVDEADSISLPVPVKEKQAADIVIGEGDGGSAAPKKEYEEVELGRCLEMLVEKEALEYACPKCKKTVVATKQSKFKSFPEVVVVHMKKFQLVNWVPTKLDIPVLIKDDLNMDQYVSAGKQEGETELVDAEASVLPEFDAAAMNTLESMGFPTIRCQKALLATGNSDAEAAMNWLFQHMEDADIDDPIVSAAGAGSGGSAGPEPSADQVAMLADMGFTSAQAKKALRETDGNAERAVEWLFSHPDDNGEDVVMAERRAPVSAIGGSSDLPANYRLKAFISHKGPSVHSGHYVATIRQNDGSWVLFNDEKVVKAEGEGNDKMKSLAYLYIYEKV